MKLQNLWQDVVFGVRLLVKSPGFAIVAILTIAVGIGGTSSVFSIVKAVLLEPLPYRDADQLLLLTNVDSERGITGINVSYTKLERIQQNSHTLASAAGLFATTATLKVTPLAEQLPAAQVTRNFFEMFGIVPAMGRIFLPEEDAPGGAAVVVVSYRLWLSRFAGDTSVIGRSIPINGVATTVIGVLPANFHVPFQQPEPDLWLPRVFESATLTAVQIRSGAGYLQVFARRRETASLLAVQNDLRAIDRDYKHDNPAFADSPEDLAADPMKDSVVGQVRPSLLTLLAATACVLLIGCANLTNLLLAKANGRRKELAIRTAMGATRSRLIAQLLTESVIVSFAGGVLGMLLALGSRSLLRLLPPGTLPRSEEVAFSPLLLVFCAALTLLSGILFGLFPALQAARTDVHDSLKENGRGTSSGLRAARSRAFLAGAEVAMAMVLLTGAGLLIKSFARLIEVDPGFDPRQTFTATIPLPSEKYSAEHQRQFVRQLTAAVAGLPRVNSAAVVNALPVVGVSPMVYCCPEGYACHGIGHDPVISTRQVTPDYFRAMGIPLLQGRFFNESDNEQARRVIVINQTAAKVFFPGRNPIGLSLSNSRDRIPLTVVGVVKDVRFRGLNVPAFQEMYIPHAQVLKPYPTISLVVRGDSSPATMTDAVRHTIAGMDSDIPVADPARMDDLLAASVAQPRLTMQIAGLFALLALLLTIIGLYGVLAYSVSQQSQEIGIRMALGATPSEVVGQVLRSGARVLVVGLAAGAVASLALTRLLQGLLFGTSARDPLILAATAFCISIAGLAACYVPARRAAGITPGVVLMS